MREKLIAYIDSLFADAPRTRENLELQGEILQNTLEKFDDLVREGKPEDVAFNLAVAGVGDVTELLNQLQNRPGNPYGASREELEKKRQKSAFLLSLAVALYILSILPIILLSETDYVDTVGPALMFVLIGLATGLIIYRAQTRIRYYKKDDTVVETFKAMSAETASKRELMKSVNAAIWSVTAALYLLISFVTMAWHITWLIFPIAGAVQNIVKAVMDVKKGDQ